MKRRTILLTLLLFPSLSGPALAAPAGGFQSGLFVGLVVFNLLAGAGLLLLLSGLLVALADCLKRPSSPASGKRLVLRSRPARSAPFLIPAEMKRNGVVRRRPRGG
jgi:hypothetical protein